jgi:ubiquitin-conjugating enzyme E2 M
MSRAARRPTACQLRVQHDLDEFSPSAYPGVRITVPDPANIQAFVVRVTPGHGIWAGGNFDFAFAIPDGFPFERPSVRCETRVWHPNIEETGAVCLNILRDSYTPVTSICHLIVGLQFLFDEPNATSPLNKDASAQLERDPEAFAIRAREYMRLHCPK